MKSLKTEVRESNIKEKGLFAKENIKKGEVVFLKSGHIVKGYNEMMELEKKLGEHCLQIADDFYLCPKTKGVKAITIAILDGVLYIKGNNKIYKAITGSLKKENIMSTLILREFLYQI